MKWDMRDINDNNKDVGAGKGTWHDADSVNTD